VLKKLTGKAGKAGGTGASGAAGTPGAQGKEGAAGKNGANGERGPSTAFNTSLASAEEIINFPTKASEALTVSSLSLPAGSFTVLGKVIANNNSAAIQLVECELLLGGTTIDPGSFGVRLDKEGTVDRQTLTLSGAGSLSSPGAATLVCKVDTKEGNYFDASITATQVATVG
jgi:hypothetical protein